MAFNPFHQFRRHNKVVFAILAIICMFTFVLSSGMGRGDIFTQLTDWATGRRSVPVYVTLYGKEYDAQQVEQVRRQRILANEYMEHVLAAAQGNLEKRFLDGATKLDPDVGRQAQEVWLYRRSYLSNPQGMELYPSYLQGAYFSVSMLVEQVDSRESDPKKDETVGTLAALRGLLSLDFARY